MLVHQRVTVFHLYMSRFHPLSTAMSHDHRVNPGTVAAQPQHSQRISRRWTLRRWWHDGNGLTLINMMCIHTQISLKHVYIYNIYIHIYSYLYVYIYIIYIMPLCIICVSIYKYIYRLCLSTIHIHTTICCT